MRKNSVLLDSCVLTSYFLDQDTKHDEAKRIIDHLFRHRGTFTLVLPPLVLYETALATLRRGVDESIIESRIYKLLTIEEALVISLSELAIFKHLRRTSRASEREPLPRTHDMLIINSAAELGSLLVTFDNHLCAIAQRLGIDFCKTAATFAQLLS